MIDQQQTNKVKEIIKGFLNHMDLEADVEVGKPDDDTIPVDLEMENPKTLIGKEGRTLAKVQHLLKLMSRDEIEGRFYIDLDINNYKEKKTSYLKEKAREVADKVALTKKERQLPAMPPYERRVIHMELADRNDVTTQSVGQDPERKVIIKPYE
ncbi:MAG: R3H domain-containing nucleic acid-binding protein [Candidatus Paceibacterota bacterium]